MHDNLFRAAMRATCFILGVSMLWPVILLFPAFGQWPETPALISFGACSGLCLLSFGLSFVDEFSISDTKILLIFLLGTIAMGAGVIFSHL
ncbi:MULTISPECIES: hypothetical protein [Pseudomonadota]|uniref:hypothetical protein n=1 Tax=Pseudomonadota TaxID=1224 RepID=UPI00186900EA|nr:MULTISPECIES: hypothetical protein [Pseudomonadota]